MIKILQFTDLHIGDSPLDNKDLKTLNLIKSLTLKEEPDLIVFTGDNVWSHGVKNQEISLKELYKTINSLKIPVALTYGNHDSEGKISREKLRQIEMDLKYLITKENSFITKDRECFTVTIENTTLYFIDTGTFDTFGVGEWAYVEPEQASWFQRVSKKYNSEDSIGLVFMHIPLPEYNNGEIQNGEINESINSSELNSGLFLSILNSKSVRACFCGHDHDNDAEMQYAGVSLVYGRVSGYQCYGNLKRGARVIEIDNQEVSTRIVEYEE